MKLLIAILILSSAAFAADLQPNEKLCSVKSTYIQGDVKKTNGFRKEIEKRTWLKIEVAKDRADSLFLVDKDGNVQLVRREPEEFLWQGDKGNAFWNGCGGMTFSTATTCVLHKLNKAASCPKP